MASNVHLDYLSLTFSPEPLQQIKALAKQGASVKREIDRSRTPYRTKKSSEDFLKALAKRESLNCNPELFGSEACDADSSRELRDMLNIDYELTGKPYNEALSDLCDHVGYSMIDTLCHGEIDRFVTRLNHSVTCDVANAEWTIRQRPTGRFKYSHSADLYVNDILAGLVCWGGTNLGCLISFTGVGCSGLDMVALHGVIKDIPGIKITRVDLAHDDLEGKRDIDWAREQAEGTGFMLTNQPPKYTYVESGHMTKDMDRKESGKARRKYGFNPDLGRTFYIGSRVSGKLYRCYEKGKQLGIVGSKWVRHELELRNKDRVIPLEVLLTPAPFFAGAYPCMQHLSDQLERVEIVKRQTHAKLDKAIAHAARQTGRLVNLLRHLDMAPDEIIKRLTSHLGEYDVPVNLLVPPIPPDRQVA